MLVDGAPYGNIILPRPAAAELIARVDGRPPRLPELTAEIFAFLDGRLARMKWPKTIDFVEALPTFNGRRINGTSTVNVNMQEFQQRVLPASVYARLPAPFNNGTFLWGYNINNTGASWPARTA